jgi:hypothetical protein
MAENFPLSLILDSPTGTINIFLAPLIQEEE